MAGATIVECRGVSFGYLGGERLLKDLSYRFRRGAFYLIGGRSGIGKSTLLRLINRLEEPLDGEIRFAGRSLTDYAPPSLRRAVVFIQQMPAVVDATVRRNLLLPFTFSANNDRARPGDKTLERLLQEVHLPAESLHRNAVQLSVGQLQRICLIRGLLLSPEVLLLDEPTSALDEESGQVVQTVVEAASLDAGVTVIVVNHRRFRPLRVTPIHLNLVDGRLKEGG